jgi:hypothetical protein
VPVKTCEEVLRLYQERYFDLSTRHFHESTRHFHEKLKEQHAIELSYTSVCPQLDFVGSLRRYMQLLTEFPCSRLFTSTVEVPRLLCDVRAGVLEIVSRLASDQASGLLS